AGFRAGGCDSPGLLTRRSLAVSRPERRRLSQGARGRPVPSSGLREPDSVVTVRHPRLIPLACLLVIMASPPARAGVKGLLLVPEVIPSPAHPLSLLTPSPRRSLVPLADGEADLDRPPGFAAAPRGWPRPGPDPQREHDRR